jgi:RHS repeat-associated protein
MLVITQNAAAGVMNTVQFDISRITGGGDNGVQVIIVEEINNIEYVIGSGYLQQGSKQTLTFTPTFDVAKLKIYGPFDEMLIATTCTKKAATVQHTYLVDVCDGDKDRYRFGFNGQEKVNEIAGIGNHNTAEFWEYDTRLGRRWNVDPVDQVSISNYAVLANNPILRVDPNGDREFESYKAYKKELGADAIAQKDWIGQDGHWLKSDRDYSRDRWSFANHTNLQKSDGYKEYKSIEQRTMFYGWYSLVEASRGGETRWAGAAYLVALNMSLLERVVSDPVVANTLGTNTARDMLSFANAGNKAIFENVFPKLADNRFAPPKK